MGEREAVLFIPGLAATGDLFRSQIDALSSRWECTVGDHMSDDSLPEMAQRILSAAPPRFALVGLSMGGYVAFEILRQAPQRVTRLALLDTTSLADTDEAKERRKQAIIAADNDRYESLFDGLWERLVHKDRLNDGTLKALVIDMMRRTGAEAFVRQQKAILGRSSSQELLSKIVVPTLVLVGDGDAITPLDGAQAMASQIPGAHLEVVVHCGHLSSVERPEAVTHALYRWLEPFK